MMLDQYELEDYCWDRSAARCGWCEPEYVEEEGLKLGLFTVAGWFMAALISGCLYAAGEKISALAVMGLWIVGVVLISPRAGIVLTLSLQVWDMALNPEIGRGYDWISFGRILAILTVVSYLRYLFTCRTRISTCKKPILLFFVFAAFGLITVVWAPYKVRALSSITKIVIQLIMIVAAVDLLSNRKALKQTFVLMAVGAATGGVYAMSGGIARYTGAGVRLMLTGTLIEGFSMSIAVAILGAVVLYLLKTSVKTRIFLAFCGVIMFLVTLRCGTRGVLLGVPISAVIGGALGYWRKLHKLILLGTVVLIFSLGGLYAAAKADFISGELRDRLMSSFQSQTFTSNLRLRAWREGLHIAARNPMGTGAGGEHEAYYIYGREIVLEAHNVFLSILVEYNIVGLGIFMVALTALAIELFRVKDPALRCGAAMIWGFCMISSLQITMHETRLFWQPIMLAMVMIEIDFREQQRAVDALLPCPPDNSIMAEEQTDEQQ